jgi:hypothetical protein
VASENMSSSPDMVCVRLLEAHGRVAISLNVLTPVVIGRQFSQNLPPIENKRAICK